MSDDPVIEKIKKLLRLGQSGNQHEAELAVQRAFELANRHHVDVESLDLDERSAAIVHEYIHCGERLSFLKKRTLNIVTTFFHVEVCVCSPRVLFVGRQTDIAIASYVFEFLVGAGTRGARAWEAGERIARRKVTQNKRVNFYQGFIYGIARKLGESQAQAVLDDSQSALIVGEKRQREAVLADLVPRTQSMTIENGRRVASAMMAGYKHGQGTSIQQPLATTPAVIPALG